LRNDLVANTPDVLLRLVRLELGAVPQDQLFLGGDLVGALLDQLDQPQPGLAVLLPLAPGVDAVEDPLLAGLEDACGVLHRDQELAEDARHLVVVDPALRPDLQVARLELHDLVEERGELLRLGELLGIRERRGEDGLVVARERLVERVELAHLVHRQRQLGRGPDRPGDPVVLPLVFLERAGDLGGRLLVAEDLDRLVLVRDRLQQRPPEPVVLLAERGALLRDLYRRLLQLLLARRGQVVHDAGDRLLELLAALVVAVEQAHAERPQRLGHVLADDAQRLRRVARDQDGLLLREQVPDQVGDRVALARARGALDEDGAGLFEPADHALLLGVGVLGQQEVDRTGGVLAVRPAPRVDPDDAEQRLRQLVAVVDRLHVALEHVGEAVVAVAEHDERLAVDVRAVGRAVHEVRAVEVPAVLPEPVHEIAEEPAGGVAIERMEVVRLQRLLDLQQVPAVDADVPQQRRVDLRVLRRLAERELGNERVEVELDALEQERVLHLARGVIHDEDAVRQVELVLLRLAVDLAAEVEEVGEHAQRVGDALFLRRPLVAAIQPLVERVDPLLGVLEALGDAALVRLDLARLVHERLRGRPDLVPPGPHPVADDHARRRAVGSLGPSDLEHLALLELGRTSPVRAAMDGRVIRKRPQLQRPLVVVGVDGRGRLDAVEFQEVPEHPLDLGLGVGEIVGRRAAARRGNEGVFAHLRVSSRPASVPKDRHRESR
jgi:hypothetical protein